MNTTLLRRFVVSTAALSLLASAAALAEVSNKWRLAVSGNAESEGEVTLALEKVGAVITVVNVAIPNRTPENDVAKRIRDELKLSLPPSQYAVETDDGEDVLIKKGQDVEDFSIRIVNNSVAGLSLDLSRE
jgi:uncharacterized protein (DUF2141 family)